MSYRKYKSCAIVQDFVGRFLNKQQIPDDSYIFKDFIERDKDEESRDTDTSCKTDEN